MDFEELIDIGRGGELPHPGIGGKDVGVGGDSYDGDGLFGLFDGGRT